MASYPPRGSLVADGLVACLLAIGCGPADSGPAGGVDSSAGQDAATVADGTVENPAPATESPEPADSAGLAGSEWRLVEFQSVSDEVGILRPPSLDERIARDAGYVRSYVLRDDRLYLRLMADAGIWVWERRP